MTELTNDLLEIKTSLVRLEGSVATLSVEMRSGDRNADSSVKLLAQVVENQAHNMEIQRGDLKDALKEFREAIITVKDLAEKQANGVRIDLEKRLNNHELEPAPHEETLGNRIEKLEHRNTQLGVIIALLTFVGWPGLILIAKYFIN